jgi:cysteine desulfurase/selenocysteine lyase
VGRPCAWRDRIVGIDDRMPLLDGRLAPYIHLDNAASTPPLAEVAEAVQRFLPYYSSVHRGTGFKSRFSTGLYDEARDVIARFVSADPEDNTVIFGKNTTEAINKLAHRYPFRPRDVVLSTALEHHSNDLPWRARAEVVRARLTPDGRLDEDHFDELLRTYNERVALVTVSGASNVTGFVQPIHRLARKAHRIGARILVDAAQLAPHRRIDVRPNRDPFHLDFVALSAHKMYAPFGTGALIGCRDVFLQGAPEYAGGGTVEIVTPTSVRWAELPDREEAGTPNVVGAVALAAAARAFMESDRTVLENHESELTLYALERLRALSRVTVYGDDGGDRVGVIAFNVRDVPHALVAAILGYEGGIAVRSGCFCAQGYVTHLLGLGAAEQERWQRDHRLGDRTRRPGMVRISLGAHNTRDDVDTALDMLDRVIRGDYSGRYCPVRDTGEYLPTG